MSKIINNTEIEQFKEDGAVQLKANLTTYGLKS